LRTPRSGGWAWWRRGGGRVGDLKREEAGTAALGNKQEG